jgi:transcriptional regulator with XRE-family HTH domain
VIAEDTDFKQLIGVNIRLARELMGLSQGELARRIDARDRNEISRYENGHRKPSIGRMVRIAAELERTVDWFLAPHEEPRLDGRP